jgi:signal transduction histidine kinase
MNRLLTGLSAALLLSAGYTMAAEFGTADEAKALLAKAAAAVKADKAGALTQFSAGANGFRDRDLYPFCGGPDGNFTAHPSLTGKSLKDLKDKTGKALGEEIYAAAKEGQISEVAYMWPRPGSTEPVPKISFVTRIDDQVCAVGYYQ